jgi:type IV pili sensor histidine kinase/response regulator
LPDAKTKGANLLHPPIVPVVTQAATQPVAVKPVPIVKTLPVAPVLKTWTIDKGPSLRKAFKEWVDKEKCPIGGAKWNFEWLTDTDYAVDYPLSFRAVDFESVTTQLFSLYRKAEAPLYVSGYRQQCLIRVSDRK